jgi:hypothetical protein
MADSEKIKLFGSITAVFVCFSACINIFGQWSGALGSTWNNPTSASISRILVDRMNQRLLAKRLAEKRGAVASNPPPNISGNSTPQARSEALRSLKFDPTPNRLKLDAVVAELGGTTDQRVQTKQLLNEVLDTYDKEASALGYKDDLPLAFASFIIMSAAAYREKDVPGDETLLELRSVIAESAIESGVLKSITDQQKQEISEILVVFGTLAFSGYRQSKQTGDVSSMNAFKLLGGQNLKTVLGLDPDNVEVGPDGISFASASTPRVNNAAQASSTQILTMHAGN